MIISHKHKFIFIKTRKTAGTSIEIYLSQFTGPSDIVTPISFPPDMHQAKNYQGWFNFAHELINPALNTRARLRVMRDLVIYRKFYNHIPAFSVRARVSKSVWETYYKFCVERNPWDKTLSHYYFRKHARGYDYSFEQYMEKGNFCLNYPLYMDVDLQEIIVDRVLKYESLSHELGEVFGQLKIPFDGNLSIRAKSSQRKIRQVYWDVLNDEQIKKLQGVFSKEIAFHGYQPQYTSNLDDPISK